MPDLLGLLCRWMLSDTGTTGANAYFKGMIQRLFKIACFGSRHAGLICRDIAFTTMKSLPCRFVSPLFSLGLLVAVPLHADTPATSEAASPQTPAAPAPAVNAPTPHLAPARPAPMPGGMSTLTPEERQILMKASMELRKDPEMTALDAQIRELMEKRSKLAEERLQKISPEAAAIVQKIKAEREKVMAERRAQMEASQAKVKEQAPAPQPISPVKPKTVATEATPPVSTSSP